MKMIVKLFAAFVVALAGFANAAGFDSAGFVDHTGNWWNPAQNFMGVPIHQQHGLIQAEWFIYDATNKPTWLAFSGQLQHDSVTGNDTLSSPLYRTHGPQPMGYNATFAGVDTPSAGSMNITFTDACHATMHYQYTDPSGGLPQQETLTLTPLLFGDVACTNPQGVKVAAVERVPSGCISTGNPCWSKALTAGSVVWLNTSARMVGAPSQYSDRPIMYGYFIDGTGGYKTDAFYADTGEPVGGDGALANGLTMAIDWVKVLNDGGLLNHQADGTCYERRWFPPTPGLPGYTPGYANVWANLPMSCSAT